METPEFYQQHSEFRSPSQFAGESKHHSLEKLSSGGGDHFMVEDLLDFSNEDAIVSDGCGGGVSANAFDYATNVGNSRDSSSTVTTVVDSCNSSSFSGSEPCLNAADIGSRNFSDPHFCNDLGVPYDDLAELEWLSNFVEESFSSEDLQKLQLISGMNAQPDESSETRNSKPDCNNNHDNNSATTDSNNSNNPIFHTDMSVPAKARSKRSRAAPGNWASRLLVLSSTYPSSEPEIRFGPAQPEPPTSRKKTIKVAGPKKRKAQEGRAGNGNGRKCMHCATDKTPQWRTGPMGPKTLCNACGVRYKSGRLVPEYRPAASPTFVLTKHSNSHRKVLELRRQKDLMRAQQQQHQHFLHQHQSMVFDVSNGDDYLIHQHVGPDFRQLI